MAVFTPLRPFLRDFSPVVGVTDAFQFFLGLEDLHQCQFARVTVESLPRRITAARRPVHVFELDHMFFC